MCPKGHLKGKAASQSELLVADQQQERDWEGGWRKAEDHRKAARIESVG